jgi:GT2 family glycosyltransferase
LRIRQTGGDCIYVPQATVRHTGETSTSKVRAFAMFHRYRSDVLVYRKQGRGTVAAVAFGAALTVQGLQLLCKGTTRDRALWWAACRGAVAGFRTAI